MPENNGAADGTTPAAPAVEQAVQEPAAPARPRPFAVGLEYKAINGITLAEKAIWLLSLRSLPQAIEDYRPAGAVEVYLRVLP